MAREVMAYKNKLFVWTAQVETCKDMAIENMKNDFCNFLRFQLAVN